MILRPVQVSESTAAKRRVYFFIPSAIDGFSPMTGLTGQPQISTDGGAWTDTGIATLTEISNGEYYADLTTGAVATAGQIIRTRFKDDTSIEVRGTTFIVVNYDPHKSIYQMKVDLVDDDAGSTDLYLVAFLRDGEPITSGITSPTVQVIKASDGTNLITTASLTQIASTGYYKRAEASNRIVSGSGYIAVVTATIDSVSRTWAQPVGRDSSA